MSKDNAENSCSSTNDGKLSIKFPNQKKENKQENGFKGLKKIFANNVV
jgi:hypothetical protein